MHADIYINLNILLSSTNSSLLNHCKWQTKQKVHSSTTRAYTHCGKTWIFNSIPKLEFGVVFNECSYFVDLFSGASQSPSLPFHFGLSSTVSPLPISVWFLLLLLLCVDFALFNLVRSLPFSISRSSASSFQYRYHIIIPHGQTKTFVDDTNVQKIRSIS